MVNTLRMTSVAAIILAVLVLASVLGPWRLVNFGMKDDARLAKIMSEPNAVDIFRKGSAGKTPNNGDQTPALVKQARAFASAIKPVEPVKPPETSDGSNGTIIVPRETKARFALIGLSYSATRPEESFAYIRMEDNAFEWVRRGDQIGHQTVQEIKQNSIVLLSGDQKSEMPITAPPQTASLLETASGATTPTAKVAVPDKPVLAAVTTTSAGADSDAALERMSARARAMARGADGEDPNEMLRTREMVMNRLNAERPPLPRPGLESNDPRGGLGVSPRRGGYRPSQMPSPLRRGS